jgi:hypothetical protein
MIDESCEVVKVLKARQEEMIKVGVNVVKRTKTKSTLNLMSKTNLCPSNGREIQQSLSSSLLGNS